METDTTPTDVRRRLLDTASRLFSAQGFGATGINQILAEADAAKASFYHHFPSKEDLGTASLRQAHRSWVVTMRDRIEPLPTARARLLGQFDLLATEQAGTGYRGCAFLNTIAETPEPDGRLRGEAGRHQDAVRRYLTAHAADHLGLTADDAESTGLGDAIYLLLEGATIAAQTHGADWPIRAARALAERLLDTPR